MPLCVSPSARRRLQGRVQADHRTGLRQSIKDIGKCQIITRTVGIDAHQSRAIRERQAVIGAGDQWRSVCVHTFTIRDADRAVVGGDACCEVL